MPTNATASPTSVSNWRQASRLAAGTLVAALAFALLALVVALLPQLPPTSDLTTDFIVATDLSRHDFALSPPIVFGPILAVAVTLHLLMRRFARVRLLINRALDCAVLLWQPPRLFARGVVVLGGWPAAIAVAAAALEVPQWVVPAAIAGAGIGVVHLFVVRRLRGA